MTKTSEIYKVNGGEYELVQRVEIVASGAVSSGKTIQLNGAQTSYTFSGLDGDVDRRYKIVTDIIGAGDSYIIASFEQTPSSANYRTHGLYTYNTIVSTQEITNEAGSRVARAQNGLRCTSIANITTKSGIYRALSTRLDNLESAPDIHLYLGKWMNIADNITSITLTANGAKIGVGSVIELYKLSE